MRQPNTKTKTGVLLIAAALVVALPVAAIIKDTNVTDRIISGELIRDVTIKDSSTERVLIMDAYIEGTSVSKAFMRDVTVRGSYMENLGMRDAYLESSRLNSAEADDVTLRDVTVCSASINKDFGFGDCQLVDIEKGEKTHYATLFEDAPRSVAPGGSYDLPFWSGADELTVYNQPAGLVGLGFDPAVDPLGLKSLGFQATAAADSVDRFELWVDGEMTASFGFGDTVALPEEMAMLRVVTAESGIIDHSRLALVLDLDGHGLRPEPTSFDVIATDLVIPPVESQLFAPFLADDVARLVLSVPIDENGNVDRDIDITFSVDVTAVHSGDAPLVSDIDHLANLHDDSRLFSAAPFSYRPTVDAAHHPQTLELLVRETLVAELSHGAINAYGTHLVVMGPYAVDLTLTASGTNANGDPLETSIDLNVGPLPAEERTVEIFGKAFDLPGTGSLEVRLVDGMGAPVDAGSGWTLFIEETPESHGISQALAISEGASSIQQDLAASKQLTTPLGNFASSEYMVCVDHDGERDCAEGLQAIVTGETTLVEINVT